MKRLILITVGIGINAAISWGDETARPRVGIEAPPGFLVTLYAGDDLAPDIYSMTIDSLGRVVVATRGSVRILIDENDDGIADSFKPFADSPANGAMGMFWQGRDLICTGDAGLLRYTDANGDDRADGPPDLLVPFKTGGEHDMHAIRKGPDGNWYLIGGNGAKIDNRYVKTQTSPVQNPSGGAVLRLAHDFTPQDVHAHGFRNPYDFAFTPSGDLFTYDSDGERGISLPWYRPTRVFQVLSGSHAGWVSRSWKRQGHAIDMPPVVASLGRGSPTGVECYRHTQFPKEYRGGLFVLDWTYGRVVFIPAADDGGSQGGLQTDASRNFVTRIGSFGFAPTDAAVGPDGSLFVSVGGRGTRGSVYRIRWSNPEDAALKAAAPLTAAPLSGDPLELCLHAPQPLCSWSRARWEPLAKKLGRQQFASATLDTQRSVAERIRAIEILTEHFDGLLEETARTLMQDESSLLRSRTLWSLGRSGRLLASSSLTVGLQHQDARVVRAALEGILEELPVSASRSESAVVASALPPAVHHPDRVVRLMAAIVLNRLDQSGRRVVANAIDTKEWTGELTVALADVVNPDDKSHLSSQQAGQRWLAADVDLSVKLDAVRVLQLCLGDVGPVDDTPPVFDGYVRQAFRSTSAEHFTPLADDVLKQFPTGDVTLDRELSRYLAMLEPNAVAVLDRVLKQITEGSHPVDDLHYLIVAARVSAPRTDIHSAKIAQTLLSLDAKIIRRGLLQDSHWGDRVSELYAALVKRDLQLPRALVNSPLFGDPGHVFFVDSMTPDARKRAIAVFVDRTTTTNDFRWTNEVIRTLGMSSDPHVRALIRDQVEVFALRSAALSALTSNPAAIDRPIFIDGLDSPDVGVLSQIVGALKSLSPDDAAAEQVALILLLNRLGTSPDEQRLKPEIDSLLQQNTGHNPTSLPGEGGDVRQQSLLAQRWTAWAQQQYPQEWKTRVTSASGDEIDVESRLDSVDWSAGDVERGEALFRARSCAECHGGRRALGPDLSGVAGRFSRKDLFTAIFNPHRDVSPRYQTTYLLTSTGRSHTGIVIYESIDGLLLRDAQGQTIRIEANEIDERRPMSSSLMPTGLLKGLSSAELADLAAYLQTIGQ